MMASSESLYSMSFVRLFSDTNIIIEHRVPVFLFYILYRFSILLNTVENSFNDFVRDLLQDLTIIYIPLLNIQNILLLHLGFVVHLPPSCCLPILYCFTFT